MTEGCEEAKLLSHGVQETDTEEGACDQTERQEQASQRPPHSN